MLLVDWYFLNKKKKKISEFFQHTFSFEAVLGSMTRRRSLTRAETALPTGPERMTKLFGIFAAFSSDGVTWVRFFLWDKFFFLLGVGGG